MGSYRPVQIFHVAKVQVFLYFTETTQNRITLDALILQDLMRLNLMSLDKMGSVDKLKIMSLGI